jgi:hypothetical protein
MGEAGRLQTLPIYLNAFGMEPELCSELDKAGEREGLTLEVSRAMGGLVPRLAAVLRAEPDQTRDGRAAGRNGLLQSFCRELDRHSHSQDAIHLDCGLLFDQILRNGRRSKCPATTLKLS